MPEWPPEVEQSVAVLMQVTCSLAVHDAPVFGTPFWDT
jgi:hypothetical protein